MTDVASHFHAWFSRAGPAAWPGEAQRVDPGAERRQYGGQHDERGEEVEEDDRDAAEAERMGDRLREEHQPAESDDDGQPKEGDRVPGRVHRRHQRLPHVAVSAREFLAEPADHEEPVVDGEAQTEQRGDLHGEDRDVRDVCQAAQHHQRAEDGHDPQGEGDGGGRHAPEDEQQQDQQDRQRDHVGGGQVLGGEPLEVEHTGGAAGDVGLQALSAYLLLDLAVRLEALLGVRAAQDDRRQGRMAVLRDVP
ncbi:hypothetical protein [Nonomuraea cypriaca]|uniref:hypothetical protein n=1 Tax=Nonomuraea cypriaca TaxID=1187855 RepID=UPI001F19039D|nr:hypothetical protein [Nonomuraea cypriaca]